MAHAMTAAPRNAPWVHASSGKLLAWVQYLFDTVPHLSGHACRSSPSDASETAFLPRVVAQRSGRDQLLSQRFLAPPAEFVARRQPVPVTCGEKTARLHDPESRLR